MRQGFCVLVSVLAIASGAALIGADHHAKAGEIKIGGAGAFDYLQIDGPAKRLYVTHGTEICQGTDATWFDPATKNIFVSGGDRHLERVVPVGPPLASLSR